jgi:diadenosine tetraphosphate (Ap4A) HIT family hydrolase
MSGSVGGLRYRLSAAEWEILDGLRSAEDLAGAAAGLGLNQAVVRQILAGIAEKLRLTSLPGDRGPEGAFEVPARDPCPYCEYLAGRHGSHGPPAVVAETELTFVFLAPVPLGGMPGHTLVATRRHVETIFALTVEEEAAVGSAVAAAARAVFAAFGPAGILVQQHNGVAAFQTVPHVHFHVVPKKAGPFPPATPGEVVPFEERARQAALVQRYWATGTRR